MNTTHNVTKAQRRALDIVERNGRAYVFNVHDGSFQRDTVTRIVGQRLVDAGLAEWEPKPKDPNVWYWPALVAVGHAEALARRAREVANTGRADVTLTPAEADVVWSLLGNAADEANPADVTTLVEKLEATR